MSRRNSLSRAKVRVRRDSGTKLDYYNKIVNKTILAHQNPVSGLLAASTESDHSWIRDDVYSILAVWALALAYKKHADKDYGRAKAYELEQSVVKLMRGLLQAMMLQIKKVEKFKYTYDPRDSLHAKYSSKTCATVVGDFEWGHLQIDAVSLYLLCLAEMTASGLQIIYTLDEVLFIQNLVFYIENSYQIPDYGIWERGDKTNHGLPELNASSIGMAKAALQALDELDLFGSRGSDSSVIHVMSDTIHWCNTILTCMLPRESNSKETDAALLSIISYPGFALDDMELVNLTRQEILSKLQGRYGCCRFIRDGYKTAREDPRRLHYEPWELKIFENIECQWPLFWCYLVLDGIFYNDPEQVEVISTNLEDVLIKDEESIKLVPELYAVPAYKVEEEYKNPKSQDRVPLGKVPHMWGQSLYIISKLLRDNLIAPGELDPLNRRLAIQPKPDLVVQVTVLAENEEIQLKLANDHNINVQTVSDVAPIQIYPAKVLAYIYSFLGKNERLGLTGRPVTDIGFLATSKLYTMKGQLFAFTASFMDHKSFYMASDIDFTLDSFRTYVSFIERNWNNIPGRPTVVFVITKEIYEAHENLNSQLISTIKKLYSGYINGARVQLGRLEDFIKTACLTSLTFIGTGEEGVENEKQVFKYLEEQNTSFSKTSDLINKYKASLSKETGKLGVNNLSTASLNASQVSLASINKNQNRAKKLGAIMGIAKRSRSIHYTECPRIIEKAAKIPSTLKVPLLDDTNDRQRYIVQNVTYQKMNDDDLLNLLRDNKSLHDEADILHYLYETKNLDWEIPAIHKNFFQGSRLRDLIGNVYEKASIRKMWWLVRHSAGMLDLTSDELPKAVLTLIVRQKQISIGLPSTRLNSEISIKSPLPKDQIYQLIKQAWEKDISMMMVTQELLIYMSLFIATEPQLFEGMIRLRLGLIIQVMIGELERTLSCSVEEATDHLLNLSPYEMKTLLHMILSGKELGATSIYSSRMPSSVSNLDDQKKAEIERRYLRDELKQGYSVRNKPILLISEEKDDEEGANSDLDKHGQWIRRRRLDGSLNRVPIGFYSKVWMALEKCQGIQIYGYVLNQSLTREMTKEELKFALLVEEALNGITEPEYRQLIVEACMLMVMLAQNEPRFFLNEIIIIDNIVNRANELFLQEQVKSDGDATLCCAIGKRCPSARGICEHFYDLAPSGRYGSMNYLFKALTQLLRIQENPDCIVC
ncbi:unnamed protein product [Brachionus calyciflorus]|uniref:Phosphorylase b kinase regulatory subunit n=1 Tax=Brachionus calyciflorus TaxID=104777 RepID=A0A813RGI1_9BILA|nr:unnamed protein product [Brachionus calyciflorus]